MNAGEIHLKPTEAREQGKGMRRAADEATQTFAAMRTNLTTLKESFRGTAANAFDAQYEQWDGAATDVVAALEGLSEWLMQAADVIEGVDDQLAQGLNS